VTLWRFTAVLCIHPFYLLQTRLIAFRWSTSPLDAARQRNQVKVKVKVIIGKWTAKGQGVVGCVVSTRRQWHWALLLALLSFAGYHSLPGTSPPRLGYILEFTFPVGLYMLPLSGLSSLCPHMLTLPFRSVHIWLLLSCILILELITIFQLVGIWNFHVVIW